MNDITIHNSFRLNGHSFKDQTELLSFVEKQLIDGYEFLNHWFDKETYIIAKTSGSTGVPKPIRIKKQQMLNSAAGTGNYFNLTSGTTALLCMSSDFIAGKMMWVRALSLGWELDVVAVSSMPLDHSEKKYDFCAMVPLQVSNSLGQLNLVKTLIVGGGVVSKALQEKLQALKTKVYATYGMTETVTHIAVKKLNHIRQDESIYYNTLVNVTIEKDSRGCLVINAPLVADDKVVTNDLISIKTENSFEWLGRYDSIINSGGVKLIPELIEKEISKSISGNYFITGIEDSMLGEKVILIIEGIGDLIDEKIKIVKLLEKSDLKVYEIPKEIHFIDKFDLTGTGKIRRASVLKKII